MRPMKEIHSITRERFERDVVGLVEDIARDLLEPLAQRLVPAHDLGAQFFRRGGGGRDVGQNHSPPLVGKTEYLFKTCNATVALRLVPGYGIYVPYDIDMEHGFNRKRIICTT